MWKILTILILIKCSNAVHFQQDDGTVDKDFVWEIDDNVNWKDFMANAEKFTEGIIQFLQPQLLNILSSVNVSEQCTESLIAYTEGIRKWEPWAIQMVDATARLPSGFLMGTKIDFGTMNECLAAKKEGKGKEISFQGQFCMIGFKSPLIAPMHERTPHGKDYIEAYGQPPDWILGKMKEQEGLLRSFGLWLGTCIPSTCSKQDIRNIFSKVVRPWASLVSLTDCQVDAPKEWPLSAKISGCILLLLCGICLLGTILDVQNRNSSNGREINENFLIKQLEAFSVYANTEKLFEISTRKSPLDSLYGIRAVLCLWVVSGHNLIYPEYWREIKYGSYGELLKIQNNNLIFFENPFLSMEWFCVLSGFFLVYTMQKTLEKDGGKVKLMEFFLQKYFRLMPSFFFALLILYIFPVKSSGPIWNSTWEFEHSKCKTNWWKNLLLINNFSHYDNICLLHSWYISVTVQLQMVGIFLMILIYKYPKFGLLSGLSTVLLSCYIDYKKALFYQIPNLSINFSKDFKSARVFVGCMYLQTTYHITSFVVGMVLGWIMVKHKDFKLPKIIIAAGWVMSITLHLAVFYFIKLPILDYKITAVYIAVRNFFFATSIAWMLYCYICGYAGIVGKILSHRSIVPFSQISYMIYLVHPIIIMYAGAVLNERIFMSMSSHVFLISGVLIISVIISYIGYISVELPFSTICDNFMKSNSSKGTNKHFITRGKISENGKQE